MINNDLQIIRNYLDWRYAIDEAYESVDFHRQLIAEGRKMPKLSEAREAINRLEKLTMSLQNELHIAIFGPDND